ncbi:hypothetical protein [Anabaena azotica]|uniref:Uncharacterized protein n=1 Tax=Anabaena azotica FACHB-119 TaxID=947527 RepID=A0ABR8CYN7_9NOST|nr:hypothetical protein [Anabaena azotica]MBD2500054.1 hypothetical protein [Anabaena azotica FACHB-119]
MSSQSCLDFGDRTQIALCDFLSSFLAQVRSPSQFAIHCFLNRTYA